MLCLSTARQTIQNRFYSVTCQFLRETDILRDGMEQDTRFNGNQFHLFITSCLQANASVLAAVCLGQRNRAITL